MRVAEIIIAYVFDSLEDMKLMYKLHGNSSLNVPPSREVIQLFIIQALYKQNSESLMLADASLKRISCSEGS